MINGGVPRRRRDDGGIDRRAAGVERKAPAALVHRAQSTGTADEGHRMPLDDLHDQRAWQLARHGDALDLRMTSNARLERPERIPHAACRVDPQAVEELSRRRIARTENLDAPNAEEREVTQRAWAPQGRR